jgi:hypothetical protein
VTNGLLVVELVSGRLKLGEGIGRDQNAQRQPAEVPVAGDPAAANPAAPTYASFSGVATLDNGYRDPERVGQRASATLDKQGDRAIDAALAQDPGAEIVEYNQVTGHNVPRVFRDFIQNGPVDGLFAFGHPITDPYWVRARIGGAERDVLVQLYQRRVVTYTPANPAAYQVEMGNVGQHYFQWRYPHLGHPWQPSAESYYDVPVAYVSPVSVDPWQIYLLGRNGISGPQITAGREETLPNSWRRSYLGGEPPRLLAASRRDGGSPKLYSIGMDDYFSDVRQHNPSGDLEWHYSQGAVSPDGTLIAMALDREDGFHSIGFQLFERTPITAAYILSLDHGCHYQSPSWMPDGSGLVFAANCGGKFAIYRADLRYFDGNLDDGFQFDLVNFRVLASTPNADNYAPRVSPDGAQVVFASNRDGQGELYVIGSDGQGERRLTASPGDDGAATWSPDSSEIIFESNRDGDYDLYQMRLADPRTLTQLTNSPVDERWPVWY